MSFCPAYASSSPSYQLSPQVYTNTSTSFRQETNEEEPVVLFKRSKPINIPFNRRSMTYEKMVKRESQKREKLNKLISSK